MATADGVPVRSAGGGRTRVLVFGIFVLAILPRAATPAVAASPIPPRREGVFSAALALVEGTFLPSFVLGRQAACRYRRYGLPRRRFGRTPKG